MLTLLAIVFGAGFAYVYFYSGDGQGSVFQGMHRNSSQWHELVTKVETYVTDPQIFGNTVMKNSTRFACLFSDYGNCRNFSEASFILYDQEGRNISQVPSNFGITLSGQACASFPAPDCPVRIEARWKPKCESISCEPTKQVYVFLKMTFQASQNPIDVWQFDTVVQPLIQLSARAKCARQGMFYKNGRCDRFERSLAADSRASSAMQVRARPASLAEGESRDGLDFNAEPVCAETITVAGDEYFVEEVDENGRAEIRVESVQGCNFPDLYVFRCAAARKQETSEDGREIASTTTGNWVQVDASVAQCDEDGNSLANEGAGVSIGGDPEALSADYEYDAEDSLSAGEYYEDQEPLDYIETEPQRAPAGVYPGQVQGRF